MIVLKENEWAKEKIETKDLGTQPYITLRRVARYYLDEHYKKNEIKHLLEIFMLQCNPNVSLVKWSDTINKAIKYAVKHEAINIDHISITDKELSLIDTIYGVRQKRLAFTLLCLAKFGNEVNHNNNGWVNNSNTEIMKIANIKTSFKTSCKLFKDLKDLGYIEFSKKVDNTAVKVIFAEEGKEVLQISDFRNLGYQYMMYCGEPCFICENCGMVERQQPLGFGGRPRKYCKQCSQLVREKMRHPKVTFYHIK